MIVRLAKGFAMFWWDFLVGDTPEITVAVLVIIGVTALLSESAHVNAAAIAALPLLTVVATNDSAATRTVGPFSASIRPFTINGRATRVFACVNERLGFELGDLESGRVLAQVDVPGFEKGAVKRHGCPSHGIGLTPDEREVWVCDAHNQALHIFDATTLPPKYLASIRLADEPGWVTFSVDGRLAYPSTGEVIDVSSRRILTRLRDETGAAVESEKLLEIDFTDGRPSQTGDQFGLGRVLAVPSPRADQP